MRIIVRSNNITDCHRRINAKKKQGWTAVTDIKLDDSMEIISYVCVMEKDDDPAMKQHRWNKRLPIW